MFVYLAIGALLAAFTVKPATIKEALPPLYVVYKGESKAKDFSPILESTFNKAMVVGLVTIYCLFWPLILIQKVVSAFNGKDDDDKMTPA